MKLNTRPTEELWQTILQACREATSTILFEQYLVENDVISHELAAVLIERAKAGVEVKCLFDAIGSFYLGRSHLPQEMIAAGVQLEFFNWLRPYSPKSQKLLYFRNHRRILIIDGKKAFTGSICFADHTKPWREAVLEIDEPAIITKMKEVFMMDWYRARQRKFKLRRKAPEGADGFYFVTSDPLPRRRFLYYRLIEAIRQAKTSVYLLTPYFLPDSRLLRVLKLAVRRGVDVRVLIPASSNHRIVDLGAETYFEDVLMAGIKIFRHQFIVHAKTTVIDDDWATVGSLNLDNISLRYNFEANVVATDPHFVADVKKHFFDNIADSKELLMEEWRNRSYWRQFQEMLVWPIRKLL